MDLGQTLTVWLARASAAIYLLALVLILLRRDQYARIVWSTALLLYLAHVIGAFETFYNWSHTIAYRETANQTERLFGIRSGAGLYLNYMFTLVWSVDCLWWWSKPGSFRERSSLVSVGVHGFMAFMFVNATVVVWLLRAVR